MSKPQKSVASMFKEGEKPLFHVFNDEIGSFIWWARYDETPGQIDAVLKLYCSPKGHFKLLKSDATEADYLEATEQYEDLRPLPVLKLRSIDGSK